MNSFKKLINFRIYCFICGTKLTIDVVAKVLKIFATTNRILAMPSFAFFNRIGRIFSLLKSALTNGEII